MLNIKTSTVSTHRKNVFNKLSVKNVLDLQQKIGRGIQASNQYGRMAYL